MGVGLEIPAFDLSNLTLIDLYASLYVSIALVAEGSMRWQRGFDVPLRSLALTRTWLRSVQPDKRACIGG